MARYSYTDGVQLSPEDLAGLITPYITKLKWFLEKGYQPHYWQILFHVMSQNDGRLCRFRNLVAGRRGGKTLGAAWDLVYYLENPREWWWDFHRKERDDPVRAWGLAKDYPMGFEALYTVRGICKDANIPVKEHRGNKWFEFENGSFLQFKTADDPQSLRGAGLNVLWIDEASFIPNEEPWQVVRPALADKEGAVICSTTPSGKNWYYDQFFEESTLDDDRIGRVEYTSLHNPYFSKQEWEYERNNYHPLLFKQEYMASFNAMAGRELQGEWLKYYNYTDLPRNKDNPSVLDLDVFIGVDPAISLSDSADKFAIAAVGINKVSSQAFLLEIYSGRIPFPEQVDLIQEWQIKWNPVYIGVEANAYQAALAQQALRLETLPPIVAMMAKGKKAERILSMAPSFKIGKIRLRTDHRDFINEWLDYDSKLKNPKDDCLDAVEIALRTAGIIFPEAPTMQTVYQGTLGLEELALEDRKSFKDKSISDEHMGSIW